MVKSRGGWSRMGVNEKNFTNTPQTHHKHTKNTPQTRHKHTTNTPQTRHKHAPNTPQTRHKHATTNREKVNTVHEVVLVCNLKLPEAFLVLHHVGNGVLNLQHDLVRPAYGVVPGVVGVMVVVWCNDSGVE